jgi:hypothetical protein
MVAVGPGAPDRTPVGVAGGAASAAPSVPFVSPLRADASAATVPPPPLPPITPAEPIPTYQEPSATSAGEPDDHEEPALPDEARAREAALATASTSPTDVGNGRVLKVRFLGVLDDRLREAMGTFVELIRARPGETRVLVYLDVAGGAGLPITLKPVAYDAEFLAEVNRRLGDGVVELSLA